ncbi:MAG: hypothetical protein HYR58_00420 [Acidobacteria bacterium]|nr:hypothetical protein [Acidobacteriota bacterium]
MKQTVGRIPSFALRGTFADYKILPGPPLASICGASTPEPQQAAPQQPQEKKKSIFDIFKKP